MRPYSIVQAIICVMCHWNTIQTNAYLFENFNFINYYIIRMLLLII